MTRIAILGSGHVGHALAAILGARAELDVVLWGRRLNRPSTLTVRAVGRDETYAVGRARCATSARRAVSGADVVVVTVPSHVRHRVLADIAPGLDACALLVAWEGLGPLTDSLHGLRIRSPVVVGLQRSPLSCRTRRLGRSVEIFGVRSRVVAATIDPADLAAGRRLMHQVFPFHFRFAQDYRCVSLSPGNPLIHPARVYACAHDEAQMLRPSIRFYGDWDDAASRVLLALHRELAGLRDALGLPRTFVRTLIDVPRPPTPADVTHDIRAERRLHQIRLPLRTVRGRHQFDRRHRFFREDIGQSLAYIARLAGEAGLGLPTADAILRWYRRTQPKRAL